MSEEKMTKSEKEWKRELSKDQFVILRKKGTEPPFTGVYLDNKEKGLYRCAGCHAPLFSSDTKFDSGSGWPSFWKPYSKDAVEEREDTSHGMRRIEVVCRRCGGHLGHVFPDGPAPTNLRYCINSLSLEFQKEKRGSE